MVDRDRRFFLRVPDGYEQQATVMEMWREAIVQVGEDSNMPVGEDPPG